MKATLKTAKGKKLFVECLPAIGLVFVSYS